MDDVAYTANCDRLWIWPRDKRATTFVDVGRCHLVAILVGVHQMTTSCILRMIGVLRDWVRLIALPHRACKLAGRDAGFNRRIAPDAPQLPSVELDRRKGGRRHDSRI